MRTLILLAAVLLAVIIRATGNPPLSELKYGDILAFPRERLPVLSFIRYKYKHYGIYLGNKKLPGKRDDQNLFHFNGPVSTGTLSNCVFDVLNMNEPFMKDNYLDTYPKFQNTDIMSDESITRRINEKLNNCRTWETRWDAFKNNCEHLATYVRYGYKLSFQCGQRAEGVVRNPEVDQEMNEKIKTFLSVTYDDIREDTNEACVCAEATAAPGAAAAG